MAGSLEGVLANIPGAGGYFARQQMSGQEEGRDVQILGRLAQLQQLAESQRQDAALRQALAGTKSPEEAIQRLMASGTPQAIALASKLRGLVPKPEGPQAIGAGGLRLPSGEIIPPAGRPTQDKGTWSEPYNLSGVMVQKNSVTNEVRTAASRPPQVRITQEAPVQTFTDAKGQLWERERGGTWRRAVGFEGALKPEADASIPPPAAGPATPPSVRGSAATGGSGFFGNIANTAADMLGAQMPRPDIEQASQALKNLRIQTITMAQDAIPGRPSNYLMQQLDKLAVEPNSLLMADQRAATRLNQTRAMLQQEATRMEREVLSRPQQYTASQLAKTRNSFGQLRQLVGEYDRMITSFGTGGATSAGRITPPPGFKVDQ